MISRRRVLKRPGAIATQATPEDTFRKYIGWSRTWAGASNNSNDARFFHGIVQRYRDWIETQEQRQRLRRPWTAFFRDFEIAMA